MVCFVGVKMDRFFVLILLLNINVCYLYAKRLPHYVLVCKRNDPNLDACVNSSILIIKPHLGKGIPEMKIPSFNPMHVPKLLIENGDLSLTMTELDFDLFDQFDLEKVHMNWKKCYALLKVFHPVMPIRGMYKAKGKLLGIDLDTDGKMEVNLTSVHLTGEMQCVPLRRKGEEYLRFTKINFDIDIGDASAHLTDIFKGNPEQTNTVNGLINANIRPLLDTFAPIFGKALGEIVRGMAQFAFDSFPLEVLLPE